MNEEGVNAVFHYQPLHRSPARKIGKIPITANSYRRLCMRLVRMPIWIGFDQHDRVHEVLYEVQWAID